MFARFTAIIIERKWVSLALLTLAISAVAAGAAFLQADFSVEAFFPRDDPETAYLSEYQDRWGEDDLLMIVADGGDRGLLARDALDGLDELATRLESLEGIGSVMSVTRVPRVNRGPAGTWIPVPLFSRAPRTEPGDPRYDAWRQQLLDDAQVVPQYLSSDGRYGTIYLSLSVDTGDLAQVGPVVHRVEEVLDDNVVEGVRFWVGGVPAIRADVVDVIVQDQVRSVPVAAILMGLLLLSLFRSIHGVIIPGVAAGVPIFMLLGIMGWTGESFGLLNQVFLALVPAIAVADAVHLVSRFHEEADARVGHGGELDVSTRDKAIIGAMAFMGVACFLTSFTTIIGFLSLLTTGMPVLQMFGLYAAVGVALAYFTVLFIVPLALLFTRPKARRLQHDSHGPLGALLVWSYKATTRHPWPSLGLSVAVTALAIWAGTLVTADWKVTATFDDDHPVSVANAIVDDHLGGVLSIEFDMQGDEGVFERPDVLSAMAKVGDRAQRIEGVKATISPASILEVTSTLVGGPDAVPENPKLVQRLYGIAGQADMLGAFVTKERDRARMIVRTIDFGAVEFRDIGADIEQIFEEEMGGLGVDAHLTGSSFVAGRGIGRVTGDMRNSLISAFLVIGVIIAVLFRSVRLGVLSLLPNALPLIWGYGAMGLLGWELEPARAVVFTIAIGISVDSAIHVIARFTEERQAGLSVDDSVKSAIFHSGRAILITTLMLMVGFAVNINSSAPATAAFGRLGTLIIASAVVSNLIVLPALLKLGFGSASASKARMPGGLSSQVRPDEE